VGAYTMAIAIDGNHTLDVGIQVRTATQIPAGTLMS